MLPALGIC